MINSGIWWVFLGVAPLIYWLLIPHRLRPILLGLASVVMLGYFVGTDLILMGLLAAYVFWAQHLDTARAPGWIARITRSTLPIWAVLIYFIWSKYLPSVARIFALEGGFADIAVPIGVSYFSFKLLHYAIEMRRGNFPAHGPGDFISWLFLAPIFTAGPIERFEHFLAHRQIEAFRWAFISEGLVRIGMGLVKKFFFGVLVLEVIENISGGSGVVAMMPHLETVSPLTIWAILFLTLTYVYLDFSAYSDIAIGSSRLFGLTIMENFNMPFLATNLQQFWQRWHMTLANWCKSYIYMSMIGLTRNPYLALFATFFVMGLWHSPSPHWLIWGCWHGIGMGVLARWGQFSNKRRIKFFRNVWGGHLGRLITLSYVALGGAFTMFYGTASVWQSVRLIARAFGITL